MASERAKGRIDENITALSDLVFSKETLDSVMLHIGRLGLASMDGWDAAGVTLGHKGAVETFGSTDGSVDRVDQVQYDDPGNGPCVDAMIEGKVHYLSDAEADERWPRFSEAALQEGIRSVLSIPLKDGESFGALNFYARRPDPLQKGQLQNAELFAAQAAVVLLNARAQASQDQLIAQLNEGLSTRTLIGQATGLLMAQEGLSSQEAFAKLVHISQTSNIKLRDLAQRFVSAWEDQLGAR